MRSALETLRRWGFPLADVAPALDASRPWLCRTCLHPFDGDGVLRSPLSDFRPGCGVLELDLVASLLEAGGCLRLLEASDVTPASRLLQVNLTPLTALTEALEHGSGLSFAAFFEQELQSILTPRREEVREFFRESTLLPFDASSPLVFLRRVGGWSSRTQRTAALLGQRITDELLVVPASALETREGPEETFTWFWHQRADEVAALEPGDDAEVFETLRVLLEASSLTDALATARALR